MKLLRVRASNFKNCCDDFSIDFLANSKKTSEDKEYELQEIAADLFIYSTTAFIGKNASGKTTAIELLDCCYSILSDFSLESKPYSYDNVRLEIIFYHEDFIYKYKTVLQPASTLNNRASFSVQELYRKKYFKSKVKQIYDDDDFARMTNLTALPEDTSIVFFVLKKKETRAIYYDCNGAGLETYPLLFRALTQYHISPSVLSSILQIFDENIDGLEMIDEHNYRLLYQKNSSILSDKELIHLLSSGTTKGMLLYVFAAASLKNGFDLLIDEVENHFHKTLVENLISLYKDKSVNKYQARLAFTTHYCEVLDMFGRQDNIWISKADEKVHLTNMYTDYQVRPELLKSKQFYNNAFDTSVNYEDLMRLKKVLMYGE